MTLLNRLANLLKAKSNTVNPSAWFPLGINYASKHRKTADLYYGTVFACIDAIASSVANITPKLYFDDGDGNPDEIFDDPILEPLHRANKWQSGSVLLYRIISHIESQGRSFVWVVKNLKGEPIQLFALNPERMRVVYNKETSDPDEYIKGYVYTNPNSIQIPFEADELIPIVRSHPFSDNPLEGISTIEMARLEVEADLNAQEYNTAFFERGAKPSGVLSTDEEVSEESFNRLKRQIEDMETDRNQWRKTLILENGLNFKQVAVNQRDMDFIEQRKLSRDEILSIFRVPKVIMAISDDVNRANAQSGEYVFAKYTLKPKINLVIDQLNTIYLPLFSNHEHKYIGYDDPVPADEKLLAETREKALYKWKTINEVRAEDGLDAVDNGDELYIPMNLVPVNFEPDEETAEQSEEIVSEPEEKSLTKNLAKIVQTKSKERSFLIASHRYTNKREKQMVLVIRQLYVDLIREVRRHRVGKSEESAEIIFERIMPQLDEFKNITAQVLLKYNTETFTEAMAKVSEYYELPFSFDLVNSGAVNYLQKRANETANSMRDSMLNKARKVIADQLAEPNFTLAKAKSRVLKVFEEEADWRSERIARTEVQTAYNEGNFRTYEQSGMVERVKWITSKNPCETCASNDQVVVNLGGTFPSGHSHPIAHPNCACNIVPYFGI